MKNGRSSSDGILSVMLSGTFFFFCTATAYTFYQTSSNKPNNVPSVSPEVQRLRQLFATGKLLHPYLPARHFSELLETPPRRLRRRRFPFRRFVHRNDDNNNSNNQTPTNFLDLSTALAQSCCQPSIPSSITANARTLHEQIHTHKHIIFILCDGMGLSILRHHLPPQSFLLSHLHQTIRSIFPSTTPAALTTFATATWPGRHGMPGWDLRDWIGCDFPSRKSRGVVQIRVLAKEFTDMRENKALLLLLEEEEEEEEKDGLTEEEIFVEMPWARTVDVDDDEGRRMIYINAYNGDQFTNWYQRKRQQGEMSTNDCIPKVDEKETDSDNDRTQFSSWQMGHSTRNSSSSTLFETSTIGETSYETLGRPEGSDAALTYFRQGIDAALRSIAQAEHRRQSTFVYLYTSHPDKHMHALGVEHEEVTKVMQGIDEEVERLWRSLGDRRKLLGSDDDDDDDDDDAMEEGTKERVDACVMVSADHGHVTVIPEEMVELPKDVVDCLEYANVGVHGKGRHAYLHCRTGLQTTLYQTWQAHAPSLLTDKFLLLTIDEAIQEKLFGPIPPRVEVRPRLGDFVVIALGNETLVVSDEKQSFLGRCQGAHGSLLPEEMEIPLILCIP